MNRRDFLHGLAVTAAVIGIAPAMPTIPMSAKTNAELWYTEWLKDTAHVWVEHYNNTILYGIGAIRRIEEYPYVESVPLSELTIPPSSGGLLDRA